MALGRIIEMSPPQGTEAVTAAPRATAAGPVPAALDVELRDVTFAYGPHARPVLQNLSLRIPAGSHLAVVGPSGIGKSTLAGLIAGLALPQTGSILLGGRPLPGVVDDYLHRAVVLIPQEAYIFAGTLRDNLAYLRPGVCDRELDRAVSVLGARPMTDLLGGFPSEIRPASLSAGQRQLIALIRAYVSKAAVTILDEATCHLDLEAEALAEEAFTDRPGTLIIIAHRISSARRASQVLLLDGTGTQAGTHETLFDSSSLYADLVGDWA